MPAKPLNQKPDRLPKLHSPPSTRYSKLLALAASCLESRDGRRGARVAAERLETLQETFEASDLRHASVSIEQIQEACGPALRCTDGI